ncbi:nicotinate-nucleotide--dimethylbenzimidazole phosphoribosyltransferase [Clostridium sp. 'White wine YQ']|uniref:nicotinate-nucleotide--dimethylbenzimidazole phosphoribosyltransferase n=1 Tax=Clostridium sp. 'White wine YQ' TaxID=3027474 RepID=UPI002366CDF7|nr:nicotinate-nucleotide--dimethylbenzimidazole phosphoribosyltransferase [Clostridium sp. 'White wine YQ']MDD7794991.1 nicotinate-nucleotide--dimethylbenzimidazole phosphoribosyltransferase [Clostridium sp. 'White wine YQ']
MNKNAMLQAKEKLDNLIKPIGSLGELENIAIKFAGITGKVENQINKKAIVIFSSDNGVCEEGVASAPQSVTAMQTINFLRGITGIGVLARVNNCDLKVIDIGIKEEINYPGLIIKKIRKGTSNIARGEAMTIEEANEAINTGIEIAYDLKKQGYDIIGTGEMGIGNTTSSSSVLIALTNCSIDEAVGRGAGLKDDQLTLKKQVIEKVIQINSPIKEDPMDVLHKVGGFDIAGMVGLYLGAKKYELPIVIDGYISAVAALIAYRIDPETKDYMFPSHISKEQGYNIAMNELGLNPMLNLSMRLGEGSGCPLAINIIENSLKIINEMGTFEEGNVDIKDYKDLWREEI